MTCRKCSCTDDDCRACVEATGEPCHWVAVGKCSRCYTEAGTVRRRKAGATLVRAVSDLARAETPEDRRRAARALVRAQERFKREVEKSGHVTVTFGG